MFNSALYEILGLVVVGLAKKLFKLQNWKVSSKFNRLTATTTTTLTKAMSFHLS